MSLGLLARSLRPEHFSRTKVSLIGFGYTFDSLTDEDNELARAFGVIFSTARKFRVMTILQVWFPFLRRFVSHHASFCACSC